MTSHSYPRARKEFRPYFDVIPQPLPTHLHPAEPGGIRATFAALAPARPFPPTVTVEEISVQDIRTIVVRPAPGRFVPSGVTVYVLHPGGYICGAPEMETPLLSIFASHGHTCVSPDYRLAPEHPYPAPWDDAFAVWDWLVSPTGGVQQLGVDLEKIIVVGTSAGSGLASSLAFRNARLEGNSIIPKLVILDSPHVDSRATPFPSMSPSWPPAVEKYMWWVTQGCTDSNGFLFGKDTPAARGEGAPVGAFVNELSLDEIRPLAPKLPPFYLAICELDCLRDSAVEFGQKLMGAGVRTDLRVIAGAPHYFVGYCPDTQIAMETKADYLKAIEAALNQYWA